MPKHDLTRRRLLKCLAIVGGPLYKAAAAAPPSVATMRISRYDIIHTRIPWAERVRDLAILNWRRENMDVPDSPHTVIRLYTDEGLVGFGEGGGENTLKRMLGRSPFEFVLDDSIGGILTAVYDLLGQATGLPVCRLFAADPRRRIQQSFWSLSYPPDLLASEAKLGARLGYRVHKVKARPWEDPVAQAAAICAVVPRDYRVWVDANGFWGSVGRTLHFARKLAEFPNYFGLESPLRGTEGYRQLKGQVPLRLAEHYGAVDPLLAIREGLLDAFIVAGRLGRTMVRLNALAHFYNVPLWVENNCWSGIGQVFQAHQAAAFPGIEFTIGCAHTAEDDLIKEPFVMQDGFYNVPQKPGLGVTLDEDAVEKYRVR
jgi:L-alanine-DL-glutamate epimerase-like enolase superfamily enzyme